MSDKPASLIPAPDGYDHWLGELKIRIHTAQQRAAQAVNRELVLLYRQIGCDILQRLAVPANLLKILTVSTFWV